MLFSWLWFVSASSLALVTASCFFCISLVYSPFTKALNDEGSKGQKITLEDEGRTITGKAAANVFAKGYETESNTSIPLVRTKLSFCNYVLCKLISACFNFFPVCFLVIPSWKLSMYRRCCLCN
jgi:hypothetical protein